MAFDDASRLGDVAGTLSERAVDAMDRKFSHIVDTVRLVLNVPAAVVTLIDGRDDRLPFTASVEAAALAPLIEAAAASDAPVIVPDVAADRRFAALAGGPARAALAVPFRRTDGLGGVLVACDTRPRIFTPHDVAVVSHLARCVVSELELYERAMRDDLTGVMRRQPFMNALGDMLTRFRAAGTVSVLSILDLDHFKRVNDQFGHLMGDRVLRVVADTGREVLGPRALFARLGGEEFAVAFPCLSLTEALGPLIALQATISRLRFAERPQLRVSASFGVSALHGALPNVSAWCKMADAALYGAKQAGRNQVRVGFSSLAEEAEAEATLETLRRWADLSAPYAAAG